MKLVASTDEVDATRKLYSDLSAELSVVTILPHIGGVVALLRLHRRDEGASLQLMRDMLKMRQLLPRLQYQYMKNRKGSRITRQRRKKAQSEASHSLEEMRAENTKLAKIAQKMQKKLMKVLAYLGEDDSLAASSYHKSERELEITISNSDYGSSVNEMQSNKGLSTF